MSVVWQGWLQGIVSKVSGDDFSLPYPYTEVIYVKGTNKGIQMFVDQTVDGLGAINYWAITARATAMKVLNSGGSLVGLYAQGQAQQGGGSTWGAVVEARNGYFNLYTPTVASTLIGLEADVVNQYSNSIFPLVGINTVFANRNTATPSGGLGSNKYNNNAWAIYISSQPRSALGEYCGWTKGIYFDPISMDLSIGAILAVGIDMHVVPVTSMDTGLWLADKCKIQFSATFGLCEEKYDNVLNSWGISNAGNGRFGVDMTTGKQFDFGPTAITIGAAGAAAALPAFPVGYVVHNIAGIDYKIPYYNS